MHDCIDILQRMPGYKNKVWEKISNLHNQFEEEKGMDGINAGRVARKRFIQQTKEREDKYQKSLDALILKTSETSAL